MLEKNKRNPYECFLEKRNTFSNDIIFIDGLWGTGKSLLGPIISGMNGVEKVKVESIYEYVSWLFHLGKIDLDGGLWMLKTYADTSQYHNLIGREINLRWSDDTGLGNSLNKLGLIRRLFGNEGDSKVKEINEKNLALTVMSHMLILAPELLVNAYGERVKVIEVVRHPLYMFEHYASYLERFDSSREFTMSYYIGSNKIPWFVKDWADEYLCVNLLERSVLSIARTYSWLFDNIEKLKRENVQILELSFEEIIFETEKVLVKLENFTNRNHSRSIKTILKKQRLPRISISAGRGHASYGWKIDKSPEQDVYRRLLNKVHKSCSKEIFEEFMKLIATYNLKYPSLLSSYE
ncbi:hypothetical protein ND860_10840 [Leptospira levettii]|uniref:hypothetical protein n=1 Tax=Leptospira levettii TaxID=2023178 RepID=UPI00223C91A0|nr:hypothetical protein [Leptospira levettii]MCW7497025.1 hypothetical protein [Leptospira levettii]